MDCLGLNPYYTGSYSMREIKHLYMLVGSSLNPYYTGSYSMSGVRRNGISRVS